MILAGIFLILQRALRRRGRHVPAQEPYRKPELANTAVVGGQQELAGEERLDDGAELGAEESRANMAELGGVERMELGGEERMEIGGEERPASVLEAASEPVYEV
jgi:hypothetical protein